MVLRTGAWGKDIVVPAVWIGTATLGVGAIPAALATGYRAHAFERNFWDYIKKTLSEIGSEKATTSQPVVVTH